MESGRYIGTYLLLAVQWFSLLVPSVCPVICYTRDACVTFVTAVVLLYYVRVKKGRIPDSCLGHTWWFLVYIYMVIFGATRVACAL